MRQGSVFRRCTTCRRRVRGRRCSCGSDKTTWAFIVDLEPPGVRPRRQARRGGFDTPDRAREAMARLQTELTAGRYVEPSRLLTGAYLLEWHRGLVAQEAVRESTRDEWDSHIRRHLEPALRHVRLQQLTTPIVRGLYADLRETGRVRGSGGLSAKSVWNIHRCLHRALADAVSDGLIARNPAAGAARKPRERPDIDFWSGDEVSAWMRWVDQQALPHDQALYRLAIQTGMRQGELLGLRWLDIEWERSQLRIAQQRSRRAGFAPPKTNAGRRTLDLSAEVLDALRGQREAQRFPRHALQEAYQDHDLVFCREDGQPHHPTTIGHRFAKQVARARVKHIRFHDLRHTSAVLGLRELGEWPDEVSKRLGHTSVAFTLDTYGHLLPKRGREVAQAFGQRFLQLLPSAPPPADRPAARSLGAAFGLSSEAFSARSVTNW